MKIKFMSVILSVLMLFSCLTVLTSIEAFAVDTTAESVYTIAGNDESLFGLVWYKGITESNTLKKTGDLYTYEIKDAQFRLGIEFQIIEHLPDGSTREYGNLCPPGTLESYCSFRISKPCDVTITFDPATHEINILGDGVREVGDDVHRYYAYSANSDAFNIDYSKDPYPLTNEMTPGEDGIYSVTFPDVQPEEDIKIDIVEEKYDGVVGFYGFNYCGIDVVKPCDVTVYFQMDYYCKENSKIWAEGDGVVIRTKPLIENMYVVGEAFGYQPAENNKMTQTNEFVYQYRADNLIKDKDYYFNIRAVRNGYTDSWNGNFEDEPAQFGVDKVSMVYPKQYEFSNIYFKAPYENASVMITLNLTNYDYVSKQNATYRIDLIGDINCDGKISITDATELQKSLAAIITPTERQTALSDVNGDGKINIIDTTEIQKMLVEQ